MRTAAIAIVAVLIGVLCGSVATFQLTDPRRFATLAQGVVVDEFRDWYCHGDRTNKAAFFAVAGLLSRLTIKEGTAPLAQAETLKCLVIHKLTPDELAAGAQAFYQQHGLTPRRRPEQPDHK